MLQHISLAFTFHTLCFIYASALNEFQLNVEFTMVDHFLDQRSIKLQNNRVLQNAQFTQIDYKYITESGTIEILIFFLRVDRSVKQKCLARISDDFSRKFRDIKCHTLA